MLFVWPFIQDSATSQRKSWWEPAPEGSECLSLEPPDAAMPVPQEQVLCRLWDGSSTLKNRPVLNETVYKNQLDGKKSWPAAGSGQAWERKMIVTFIQCSWQTRHCSKNFICVIWVNRPNSSMLMAPLWPPLKRWGHRGRGRVSGLHSWLVAEPRGEALQPGPSDALPLP